MLRYILILDCQGSIVDEISLKLPWLYATIRLVSLAVKLLHINIDDSRLEEVDAVEIITSLDDSRICLVSLGTQQVQDVVDNFWCQLGQVWHILNHLSPELEIVVFIVSQLPPQTEVNLRILFLSHSKDISTHGGKSAVIGGSH